MAPRAAPTSASAAADRSLELPRVRQREQDRFGRYRHQPRTYRQPEPYRGRTRRGTQSRSQRDAVVAGDPRPGRRFRSGLQPTGQYLCRRYPEQQRHRQYPGTRRRRCGDQPHVSRELRHHPQRDLVVRYFQVRRPVRLHPQQPSGGGAGRFRRGADRRRPFVQHQQAGELSPQRRTQPSVACVVRAGADGGRGVEQGNPQRPVLAQAGLRGKR